MFRHNSVTYIPESDFPPFRERYQAEPYTCPRCDLDQYDMEKVRVILRIKKGWRFGTGPGKHHFGIDLAAWDICVPQ